MHISWALVPRVQTGGGSRLATGGPSTKACEGISRDNIVASAVGISSVGIVEVVVASAREVVVFRVAIVHPGKIGEG